MECHCCGSSTKKEGWIRVGKLYFCSADCKKIYDFYTLEDLVLKYCKMPGNHCGICPIKKECDIFLKIEKQISSDDDILKFDIPIVTNQEVKKV